MTPLSEIKARKRVLVVNVTTNGEQERRLRELGFHEGSFVDVLYNKNGYSVVRIRGAKYGLSPEISRHVIVTESQASFSEIT